ncbi:hypothetical protein FHG66_06555 [Rubellimicrobium rubrum]|uniref:Uncharacterized protein n=1 Tax=Rubellimicrobium rubrum TaxID=2585369 RepID=A0A5C4N2P8_9RHOB|nr:hypothetical protein [Rubellimicrobium rubrum]TNC51201.1 hypothetical protein FHG66_06555 [Rubellimicrobium rubrum]
MKFATLTASTAVLLLSSTAIMAQEAGATTSLDNVYVDVGGQAIQVPVAQAAQACGLDEAAIQQVASTRLEESGLDPAVVYGLGNETASATDSTGATGTEAATSTDTAAASGTMDSTGTATADAGAAGTAGATATGTDMAATDAGTTGADASATDMASTDTAAAPTDSGTTGMTSDMATADAAGSAAGGDLTGTVQDVESTAADTSATGTADPMMQLVVCQIDQAQATQAGIDVSGAGAMGTTGATGSTATE